MKKFISGILSIALMAAALSGSAAFTANAEDITLPSSVDLSQPINDEGYSFLPPIGRQSNNSCVAWATTYYQFSYGARKLYNETYGGFTDDIYSPVYTYNNINNGFDRGSNIPVAYELLKNRGALKIDDFTPENDFYRVIPNDIEKMREALKLRISNYHPIKSSGSNDLTSVKQALNDGKVLTTEVYASFEEKPVIKNGAETKEKAVIYSSSKTLEHAIAIVGYDDTIQCDINDDGIIEDAEKGAFKVANSWGTVHHNNGYAWIMYDTINEISNLKSSGNRVPTFSNGNNTFYSIDLEYKDVDLIAQFDFLTTDYRCINITTDQDNSLLSGCAGARNFGVYGNSIVFDVSNENSLNDNLNRILALEINCITFIPTQTRLACDAIKITDSEGNIIAQEELRAENGQKYSELLAEKKFDQLKNSYSAAFSLSSKIGDVNYDGKFDSEDVAQINAYLAGEKSFSSLQKKISKLDFNPDRVINEEDAQMLETIISKQLSNNNGNSVSQELSGIHPDNFMLYDMDGDKWLDKEDINIFKAAFID